MKKVKNPKVVPFNFYIDVENIGAIKDTEESRKEQELLDDFKRWMSQVFHNNRECSSDRHYFQNTHYQYMGFRDTKIQQNYLFGAHKSNFKSDFKEAKEVSLEYWDKNIRMKTYDVVSCIADDYGDFEDDWHNGINENNIDIVQCYRYDVYKMPTRSFEITKALKRGGWIEHAKKQAGGYLIKKHNCQRYMPYGYAPVYSKMTEFNASTYPLFDAKRKINHDKKRGVEYNFCERTKKYANVEDSELCTAIDECGNSVEVCDYYFSITKSKLHGLFFTSGQAARDYGFVHCPVRNDYVKPEEVREVPNAGYHNLPREFMCDVNNTKFTIGLEIEKEDQEARDDVGYKKLFDRTKWCKERDGSLDSDTGFELISPVYDLMSNRMDQDVMNDDELKQLCDASYSNRCGGHINIGSNVYSPIQLLWGIKGFLPLLYSIWSIRLDNHYSRALKTQEYGGSKNAIKVKANVVEIRLATAVKSVKNMFWRRDLVRIMMNNINKSEQEVLRMMLNPRSILHKHLRKVYNSERFMQKCNDFVKFTDTFSDIRLEQPNWEALDAAKAERLTEIEED